MSGLFYNIQLFVKQAHTFGIFRSIDTDHNFLYMLLKPCFNRLPVCPTHIATTKGHLNIYNRISLMCLSNMLVV